MGIEYAFEEDAINKKSPNIKGTLCDRDSLDASGESVTVPTFGLDALSI